MVEVTPSNPARVAVHVEHAIRVFNDTSRIGPIAVRAHQGRCLALVGANGAGKTTLMRMMTGAQPIDHGRITVGGRDVQHGRLPHGLAAMIEEPRFYPALDGRTNLRVMSGGDPARRARVEQMIDLVGLNPRDKRPVRSYSQGMRQRLGIARVLMCNTPVVILDEPTNGMDPLGVRWFRSLITDLTTQGRCVILSSHLLHEVEQVADDYLMLVGGRAVDGGQLGELSGSLEERYFEKVDGHAG